jgi:hypothetical protein
VIVRELIAMFGIQLDAQSVARADAAYSKVRTTVQGADRAVASLNSRLGDARGGFMGMGPSAGGAAAGVDKLGGSLTRIGDTWDTLQRAIGAGIVFEGMRRSFGGLLGLASDAAENNNVLNEVFEEGADSVRAWASQMSDQIGRSEYTLRGFAATMGAMLLPMLEGNKEAAAEMSTTISALAVDLSSFFNTAEADALVALRAGLAGESEPLRRYGVVLLDATLQEFALAQGIRKRFKDMNVAEKTALRYQFILANTTKAQGDAMRTADEYANSLRAVQDGFKDLGTRMGERLLPIGKRVLGWLKDAIGGLRSLMERTHLAEVAMGVLAAAGIALAVALIMPFLPAIIAAAKFVAILTLIGLAVDDVITFFMGGKSAIGEFIDAMFGVGTSAQFVDDVGHSMNALNMMVADSIIFWTELYDAAVSFGEDTFEWLDKITTKGAEFMRDVLEPIGNFLGFDGTGPLGGRPALAPGGTAPRGSPFTERVFTRPMTGTESMVSVPSRAGSNVLQDVLANITLNGVTGGRDAVEQGVFGGLRRALQDAREALVEELE